MLHKDRKRIARLYDQRGTVYTAQKGTYNYPQILFPHLSFQEIAELKRILRTGLVTTRACKGEKRKRVYSFEIAKRKDVLEFCVLIYPYLKVEYKRNKIVEVWHEAGWCICDDVREEQKDVVGQ